MIIEILQIVMEYVCFILCIHKLAKKKVNNWWILLVYILVECLFVLLCNRGVLPALIKPILMIGFLFYTRLYVVNTWFKACTVFGVSMLVIISLQLLQMYLFSYVGEELLPSQGRGIAANAVILVCIVLWNEKWGQTILIQFSKHKTVVVALFVIVRLGSLFTERAYVSKELFVQFLLEIASLFLVCLLWGYAEKEKKHKMQELKMYEIYNQAFEEAISAIRTKQHEFDNHLHAIKCMQYTIKDREELVKAQNEYCEKVMKENHFHKLLRLNKEPVLVGFLYSKMTAAQAQDIHIDYKVGAVDVTKRIPIYELVELFGILFDNAIEALQEEPVKRMFVQLSQKEDGTIVAEVANTSRKYTHKEMEKFFQKDYSTKGKNRGVGLFRLKELCMRNRIECLVENCTYEGQNFMSFQLILKAE